MVLHGHQVWVVMKAAIGTREPRHVLMRAEFDLLLLVRWLILLLWTCRETVGQLRSIFFWRWPISRIEKWWVLLLVCWQRPATFLECCISLSKYGRCGASRHLHGHLLVYWLVMHHPFIQISGIHRGRGVPLLHRLVQLALVLLLGALPTSMLVIAKDHGWFLSQLSAGGLQIPVIVIAGCCICRHWVGGQLLMRLSCFPLHLKLTDILVIDIVGSAHLVFFITDGKRLAERLWNYLLF